MVTVIRRSLPFRLVLAVYALAACMILRADDADAKARAALALAVAKQAPPVVGQRPARTPEQAAKAALAEAKGRACDCGLCDAAKPMPPAVPPTAKEVPKRTVEKLTYGDLTKAVEKLASGESIRVYVGQKAPETATGRLVELTDTIPGEEQIVGVFRFWIENGKGVYQTHHGDDKPTRVMIGKYWYDRYADGSLFWCVKCNEGR